MLRKNVLMKILLLSSMQISWKEALKSTIEAEIKQSIEVDEKLCFDEKNNIFSSDNSIGNNTIVLLLLDSQLLENQNLSAWIENLNKRSQKLILASSAESDFTAKDRVKTQKIAKTNGLAFYDVNRYISLATDSFYSRDAKNQLDIPTEIVRFLTLRLTDVISTDDLFNQYYYGACMYPEVWSQEVFEEDVKHMRSIGMNFARIGEFIWSDIEPEEGHFDLSIIETALKIYQDNQISVCLCIPTPTPPRWLTVKHPESKIVNLDGTIMEHGSRQHACTNNPDYQKYAYRMTRQVSKLAEKYDNVVAVQLDNEFKCHVDLCYCDSCRNLWIDYLKVHYESIEKLNASWGTAVWSERYDRFEDVVLPTTTPFLHNSSLMNAFRKFTAESLNDFAHNLTHLVRLETKKAVTHNTAFGFNLLNDELFEDLDIAGFDTYAPYSDYPAFTLNLDRWRNVRLNRNEFLLLETSTSHAGHIENYISPAPEGWITAELFTGFAGNLKAFTYWHFRNHAYGVEQPHSTVVTTSGEPGVGYDDVVKNGQLLKEMTPFLEESRYQPAKIGFMYSDHAKRFYNIDHGGFYNHRGLVTEYYGSLIRKGINLEVIHETSSYEDFDLMIVPFIRWVSPEMLVKLQSFVETGGKLILGPMTGDRTEELAWPVNNGLGIVGEWLQLDQIKQYSVQKIDFHASYKEEVNPFAGLVTRFNTNDNWTVLFEGQNQDIIAAKRKMDKGEVIYLGGLPRLLNESSLWDRFVDEEILVFETDRQLLRIGDGLKKYRRETENSIQIYLCNMSNETKEYSLHKASHDLLTGAELTAGQVSLQAYEYQILEFEKSL